MKKSDFSQKLLDDLRLRKQRLAAANTPSASDAHESTFHRPYQGSRASNIHEITGRQSRNYHGHHKSLVGEGSKEIVSIHRTQSSECLSDLSLALAFALENGGRLGKFEFSGNAVAGKKILSHNVGRRSIDFGEMDSRYFLDTNRSSTSRFPHLSHLHIKEISKGAQKLNQILKGCSNGLNFERYSIEIGKELLKGAIDLEESLRMLVNLQEASEHMVAPRRGQIKLLEGEDDEDEDTVGVNRQMILHKPRFSFDGSSRNYIKEVAKTSLVKQKLQLLSYNESMSSRQTNSQKHTPIVSNLVSHRRSASYDLDSRSIATFSDTKKDSRSNKLLSPFNSATTPSKSSKPDTKSKSAIKQPNSPSPEQEKGRIPSVIAKLMGLEELPLKSEAKSNGVQKARESKQGTHEISKQKAQRSIKEVDSMTMSSEKSVSEINQQIKVLQANKIMLPLDTSLGTVVSEGKQNRKDLKYMENMNPIMKNSQKPIFEIHQQTNLTQVDQIKENKTTKQEAQGRAENAKHREEKNTGKGDQTVNITQKPVFEFDSQKKMSRTHDNLEAKFVETAKRNPLPKEQKIVKEKIPLKSNQHKPLYDNESKQQPAIQKSEPKDGKHEPAEREQNTKIKLRIKDARSDMMLKNSLKSIHQINAEKKLQQRNNIMSVVIKKNSREIINAMQPKGYGNSTSSESNTKELANGNLEEQRPTDSKADVEKAAPLNPPVVILKPAHNLYTQKVDNKQVQKSEKIRNIEEERDSKVESLQATTQPLKPQRPVLHELKQKRQERITEATEAIVSIQPRIFNQHKQKKAASPSPSLNPPTDDSKKPKEREKTLPENANSHAITIEDQELKSDSKAIQSKGLTDHNIIENCNALKEEQQPNPKSEIQEGSLTVHENHLKQILIKSQHFLNAAEAFFNLHIPADILHASYHTRPDKDNKLVIDCAYEVMKTKGRRKEQAFHPSMKIPIVSVKVKSFDDLVKELNEDLDHLNFHGKMEVDYDAVHFLDKLLKRDIQDRNRDANCMWDFGWSDSTCGYLETDEVIKDVEKHVLNRLIDEITKDLLV